MYSNEELNAIHSSKVGFEFEFFANESLDSAKESLSRTLNKKIRIEEKAHSDFAPTEDVFKMEPDNSGSMLLLVVKQMRTNSNVRNRWFIFSSNREPLESASQLSKDCPMILTLKRSIDTSKNCGIAMVP